MPIDVKILRSTDAIIQHKEHYALRIALIIPESGVLGMNGPSALEASILAAHEINSSIKLGVRKIEFVIIDSGQSEVSLANKLLLINNFCKIDACIGLHTSQALESVDKVVENRLPYIFSCGFEATRDMKAIYTPGETPSQFVPSLLRISKQFEIHRWAIIGTDYIWPYAARDIQRRAIEKCGSEVVLDKIIPLKNIELSATFLIGLIERSNAEGVILNVPGQDLVILLRALRSSKLEKKLVRLCPCLEENVLYALGGDYTNKLFASMHSFDNLKTDKRQKINDRYKYLFGTDSPVINAWAEHCYDAVHLISEYERNGWLKPSTFKTKTLTHGLHQQYTQHLAVAEGYSFKII